MAIGTSTGSGHLRSSHPDGRITGSVSLGELLRAAREARGLTLERIAQETRIPQRHLEALEHGDLGPSPAGFYQRAELRAYARAVGLDTELALARLQSAVKPAEAANPIREAAPRKTSAHSRTFGLVVLAAVVVAAAVVGRTISQPEPQTERVPPSSIGSASPALSVPPDTAATPSQSPSAVSSAPAPNVGVQAAAETPVPVNAVTELVVTTQPEGARVTVNGIGWGVSPVTLHHISPGEKRIRVSKEGYTSQERVLQLGGGQQQTLDIRLDATP